MYACTQTHVNYTDNEISSCVESMNLTCKYHIKPLSMKSMRWSHSPYGYFSCSTFLEHRKSEKSRNTHNNVTRRAVSKCISLVGNLIFRKYS